MSKKNKECTKCKKRKLLSDFYWDATNNRYYSGCKKCHIKIVGGWGPEHPEKIRKSWVKASRKCYEKYPQKWKARRLARHAVKMGELAKLACECCGNFLSEIHHPNYDEPFSIWWLCRKHHRLADKGELQLYV